MKNMTNTKAFWICFFAPVASSIVAYVVGDTMMTSSEPIYRYGFYLLSGEFAKSETAVFYALLFYPLLLLASLLIFLVAISLFALGVLILVSPGVLLLATPFFVARKHGKQFREKGFLGSLAGGFATLFFGIPLVKFMETLF